MGFSAHRRHDEGFERSIEVMTFPVAFEIMDSNPFSCPAFRESVSPKPMLYIVFQPVFGHAFGPRSGLMRFDRSVSLCQPGGFGAAMAAHRPFRLPALTPSQEGDQGVGWSAS